jgi:hypothetical protein
MSSDRSSVGLWDSASNGRSAAPSLTVMVDLGSVVTLHCDGYSTWCVQLETSAYPLEVTLYLC